MTTKPMTKPTSVKRLEQEVMRLRSFVVSLAGEDTEGVYRPEFVEEMLSASAEKPATSFTTPAAFLKHLDAL